MKPEWLIVVLVGIALFAMPVLGQPIAEQVQKELPSVVQLYKTLHAAPELSHYEEKTAAIAAKELRAVGCEVISGLGKFAREEWKGHGVAGVLKNGDGPVVLIRAELDALPITEQTGLPYASKVEATTDRGQRTGVMHACGHDIHLASLIGTARLLAANKPKWRGVVVFVGQPAEETLDGARALIADGLFNKVPTPNYCLALHCAADMATGEVGITPGSALGSVQGLEVTIRGKGGPASRAHETKDPIVVSAQIILALQTIVSRETSPLDPVGVTVSSIHAGAKVNVVPDEVKLLVSVRAFNDEARDRAIKSVERICKGIAQASGIPDDLAPIVTRTEEDRVSALYNDPAICDRLMAVFRREIGEDKVSIRDKRMTGDDFAHFGNINGKVVPCTLFWLGTLDPQKIRESRLSGLPPMTVHNARYAPVPDISLETGMCAMTNAVLDLLKPESARK